MINSVRSGFMPRLKPHNDVHVGQTPANQGNQKYVFEVDCL